MKNFVAYTNGLELVRALRPIIEQLRRHSSDAANQVERAGTSLILNLAEGSRRHGRDPLRFYMIASGSASEILGALDVAAAWGWPLDDQHARALLDRERRLLWGLTHPETAQPAKPAAGAQLPKARPRA
jgi:four helix bundle protein